jgi:DNA-directed RNA polymerase specialized sigma24 family protein
VITRRIDCSRRFRRRGATTADTADAIPSTDVADFDAAWPVARARLAAVLQSRGAQAADIDDIAQDVAVRALRAPERFESQEHLLAWCCRVGINLHIDSIRRQRRLSLDPPADSAGNYDTAATVERRLALEVLAKGIADLSDDERHLLFELERAGSRREAVRLAVRRHRLRARLAALVEGMAVGAVGVALVRRWSRVTRSMSRPVKLSLATAPVIAVGLMLGPLTPAGPSVEAPAMSPRTDAWLVSEPPPAAAADGGLSTARVATPTTTASRVPAPPAEPKAGAAAPAAVVDIAPVGVPVRVTSEQRPDDQEPLFCTGGLVGVLCVPRPPGVPEHTLPSLP